MNAKPLRVLYAMPDGPVMGGMTMITRIFYEARVFERGNIHHFNTYFTWGESGLARLCQSVWLKVLFLVAIRRKRIDVVFVMTSSYWGFYDKIAYCLIARALGKHVVLNPVGGHFMTFLGASPLNRWIVPRLLKVPNVVATGTSYWVDYFKSTFGLRRVVVMPNPVLAREHLTPRQASDKVLTVLFLTRLETKKGVWEFVQALEQLLEAGFNMHFVIAGSGSQLEGVRARLAPYLSSGAVRVHGWVSEEEKDQLFREADIYVLPTYLEVLPVSMLEAMSYGVAIIVTDVCGNSDAIEDGVSGLLVEPENVPQIVEGIMRFDRDRALMALVANAGLAKCQACYSLEAVLARHMETFRRLAGQHPDGVHEAASSR